MFFLRLRARCDEPKGLPMTDFLLLAFVFLIAGVIAVPIATRLGLGSVLGYLIAEKAMNPKLSASKMVTDLMNRYNVQISVRMIQHVWQHYGVSKKS